MCQLKIVQNTVIKMNALGRFLVLDFSRYVPRSLFTKDFLGNTQKYTSHDADPIFAFWAQTSMYVYHFVDKNSRCVTHNRSLFT